MGREFYYTLIHKLEYIMSQSTDVQDDAGTSDENSSKTVHEQVESDVKS